MEQNNQQQQFKCTGDCFSCRAMNERKTQWQYCAAQHAYNAMRMIQSMQETIGSMSGEIKELRAKVNAIQDSEALVFAPDMDEPQIESDGEPVGEPGVNHQDSLTPIAQEGSGAT